MNNQNTVYDSYTFDNFIAIENNVEAKNIALNFARQKMDKNNTYE